MDTNMKKEGVSRPPKKKKAFFFLRCTVYDHFMIGHDPISVFSHWKSNVDILEACLNFKNNVCKPKYIYIFCQFHVILY